MGVGKLACPAGSQKANSPLRKNEKGALPWRSAPFVVAVASLAYAASSKSER